MTVDPALPPSDVADTRNTSAQLDTLTRRPQFTPQTIPFAVIGGTPRDSGFQSTSSTTMVEIIRADAYVTAPYLVYDIQISTAYQTTPPTSVDWQITAAFPYNSSLPTTTVIASGSSGVTGTQFSATVDLFTALDPGCQSEYITLRLSVKRTGGSGDAAAIRMIRPWVLRAVG